MQETAAGGFVGRERELGTLRAALAAAGAGRGRIVLLSGEPGIGKTRTAEEFVRDVRAADGAEVLVGRCYEGQGAPAFWPWVQVLRAYATARDPATLAAELGTGSADVAAVVPEISAFLPSAPRPSVSDDDQARFRFFDGVTTCLRRAAWRRPIVLMLDDLHGADKPSLLLLQFLAREIREARLLVVGAYRDMALGPEQPLAQTLGELVRERIVETVELAGLDSGEVAALMESIAGAAPASRLAAAVYERTGGNPLYVTEVARSLGSAGRLTATGSIEVPESVRVAIGTRLATLSPDCRHLLTLGALCGREFRCDALGRAAECGPARVLELLDEAAAVRIIGPVAGEPGRWRFTHALLGETLVQELGTARRAALHRRTARALAADTRADEMAAEIAHHWFAAGAGGDPDEAVAWCCRAGDRARSLFAWEETARLYDMALTALGWTATTEEARTAEVLLALGDAHKRAGEGAEAKAVFLRAAAVARRLRSAELLTRAALGFAPAFGLGERPEPDPPLVALLEEAIAAWYGRDSGLHARALARLAAALFFGDGARRSELVKRAVAMARRVGDPATLRYVLMRRLFASMLIDELDERLATAAELVESAERAGDLDVLAQGRASHGSILLERGDIRGFAWSAAALGRLASDLRQPVWSWYARVQSAAAAAIEGRFEEAERAANEALAIGQEALPYAAPAYFASQMLMLRILQGRAAEVVAAYRAIADLIPDPRGRLPLLFAEAELGNEEEAGRFLEQPLGHCFGAERDTMWLLSLGFLAEICAIVGNTVAAAALYEVLSPYATLWISWGDGAGTVGPISLHLGLLARVLGRLDEAAAHFECVLPAVSRAGARPFIARVQYEYALVLHAREAPGDAERADALLTAALATAESLGMAALRRRIIAVRAPAIDEPAVGGPQVFRREGDVWTIAYEGRTVRLRDMRGLHYLAELLRAPGRELHATELVGVSGGLGDVRRAAGEMRVAASLGDAGPVLDGQAPVAYRARLGELREELEEAERLNDLGRLERARAELAALRAELGTAARGRRAASQAERARLTVTKGIGAALAQIGASHPALGMHLRATVRRGYFCAYVPDPRRPISWLS